jgi:enoyl-CoA hydratase/carnithine racemase
VIAKRQEQLVRNGRKPPVTEPTYETIAVERRGRAVWITLNRPEAMNAISLQLAADLHLCLDRLYQDREAHVVVLRGAGKAFCAGLDLRESASGAFRDAPFAGGFEMQSHLADLYLKMRRCPQPIVALVHGAACGGGFAFALAADVRIAATSARMSVATTRLGLSGCEMGMSWFLPRIVGAGIASELMLTARFIDADRALRVGLVNEVVPEAELERAAEAMVADMLLATPVGLRLTKEGIAAALNASSLEAAMMIENRNQLLAGRSEDAREAQRAFLEKRAPVYTGR